MSATRPVILCVDDDADIRAILKLALELDPVITVHVVGTADEALHLLAARPPIDLVLLDVHLPRTSGLEMARAMRDSEPGAMPPFVFLTAAVRAGDLATHRAAGALGTIAKPFDPLTLAAQVRAFMDVHRAPLTDGRISG